MINKIKLYIVLGVIALISGVLVHYFSTYTFVEKKEIQQKTKVISQLIVRVKMLDSLVYSYKQDLDICEQNKPNYETVIAQLTKERNEARAEAKRNIEAIEHYEQNDLIRYFVYDGRGLRKGCYKEVFEKPDNICK